MISFYYDTLLITSLLLTLVYVMIWHKHFDVHITLIFALVDITCFGYSQFSRAQSMEAALVANSLSYMGGCFLLPLIMLSVFSLCSIRLPRWLRVLFFAVSSVVNLSVLTAGHSKLFYKSIQFERINDTLIFHKEYGFMHHVYIILIFVYFLMSLGAMLYSYLYKNQVSRQTIFLLFLPIAVSMICFFGGRNITDQIELVPVGYVFAEIVFLIIAHRLCLYDITDTSIDTLVETGTTGFISFDFRNNYLGSNETAKRILPALNDLTVDSPAENNPVMQETVLPWLNAFREDEASNKVLYPCGDRIYLVNVTYLFDGNRKRGYQLFLTDDTQNQKYIHLLGKYNTELQNEVEQKTAHIVEMHDRLILSMAAMVESRDNSTGGHIKRTSEGVRILIGEMQQDPSAAQDETFCRDIIKAAPMHDLGKIAVDDAILRKPGRFTDEEFEKMKVHAAEGARIVHEVLEGTDDEHFRRIAENVAHYHHERWDGSGYPEGLKGEEIPLEARIMAIADVYDALVSKRVYKERMSFEKADSIIMEGMGKHFDKGLEPYYVSARPKLEAYYRSLEG